MVHQYLRVVLTKKAYHCLFRGQVSLRENLLCVQCWN